MFLFYLKVQPASSTAGVKSRDNIGEERRHYAALQALCGNILTLQFFGGENNLSLNLRYYERNLLFLKKSTKAVYKFHMQPYSYQSEDQKQSILNMLHDFFWIYRGKGKILRLNKVLTADEIVDQLDELQQENPFPGTYEKWKEEMRLELVHRRPWVPVLYFVLDLPKKQTNKKIDVSQYQGDKNGLKELGRDIYMTLSSAGMQALGMAKGGDIEEDEAMQAIADENTLHSTFRQAGKISKATPADIEFLLKAPFYRELGEVPISTRNRPPVAVVEKAGKTYLRPQKAFTMSLFNDGWVEEDWKHLAVQHGERNEQGKTSYQTHLVLTGLPDDIAALHNEWLYWLTEFQFPTDVCINFEIKDPSTEIRKVRSKKHDIKGELSTQMENDLDSELDGESYGKGTELERKLAKGQPLMEMETIICVAGQDKESMKERANEVQNFFASRMFDFSIVPSKAEYCFQKFFPWAQMDEYWRFPCDPGFISSGGIHCTSDLGTETGSWLGSTWNEKPILADFGWPMRNNRPGTIVLLGSMGGGKSATMKKIVKVILLLGGFVFIIDPKDEFQVFLRNQEIHAQSKLIKFGAGMESTKINIFMTSTNHDRAWQTVKNYLYLILNGKKNEIRGLIINKMVRNVMSQEHKSMMVFIEELGKYVAKEQDPEKSREAEILLDILDSYQEDPLAKIVFHDDPDELHLDQYRMVIANLKGLKLPKKGADMSNLDDTTKLSLGVVLLIGSIGRELMQHRPNDILKAYAVDEFWILEGVEELQSLNKELVKMSRSQYVVPIFATQEGADVKTQDVRNNLGWVFCGKTESKEQIEDACTMLGIEDRTEDIYNDFRGLESGHFFVRDPLGRKDQIKVYQPPEWLALFDTTPKPAKKTKVGQ